MSTTLDVQLQNVTKKFGSFTALKEASLDIHKGEIVGFVGANGAGKTTTISTILGFISPTKGEIKLFGKPLTVANAHSFHRRMSYAAGDMGLPTKLSGIQFLRFVLSQQGGLKHKVLFDDLCDRFKPELNKKIGELSRGNRQKIALIAAFMTKAELIILDEPTSGLDPVMQEVFLDLVRETAAEGRTIFMSSHYLNEVADVCSRVVLMRHGVIIEDMPAKELLEKSGKQVHVVTGYMLTKPPKNASHVTSRKEEDTMTLSFSYKGDASELQRWIAALKQLRDLEISEYNLEDAFKGMYDEEKVK